MIEGPEKRMLRKNPKLGPYIKEKDGKKEGKKCPPGGGGGSGDGGSSDDNVTTPFTDGLGKDDVDQSKKDNDNNVDATNMSDDELADKLN